MATAKTETTTTRGNTYVLTATGKKHLADVSGQGAQIRDILKTTKKALTMSEIVDRLGKTLKTPSPKRTVSFYLCTWKADGFVRYGAKTA